MLANPPHRVGNMFCSSGSFTEPIVRCCCVVVKMLLVMRGKMKQENTAGK